MPLKKSSSYLLCGLALGLLMSCQSVEQVGDEGVISVQGFDLYIQQKNLQPAKKLHIYIEGDGRPWINNRIATDPGPFNSLALSLMQQDQSPSVYLGRPCYFQSKVGLAKQCNPGLWTRARYSQKVVDILIEALGSRVDLNTYQEWILIGHSGGGTLAYLMAQELPKVKTVIAISSNLNLEAWVSYHKYAPLDWSLDPAKLKNTKPVEVYYLAAGKDENVPLKLNKSFLDKVGAKTIYRADYNHVCCWKTEWIELLQRISTEN